MKFLILFGLLFSILTAGCCCAMTPESDSGFCPYGTYGSACSNACTKTDIPNCVSTCMDDVRAEGLGDATTCCTSTFRQYCDDQCNPLMQYGADAKQECLDECHSTIAYVGLDLDSCYIPV